MNCPTCRRKLIVSDSRHSTYTIRPSVCARIAYDIGGDNAVGRVRRCKKCEEEYYSVETLEKKKKPKDKENVWD